MKLAWDETGTRTYETGVDHGVLYLPDEQGAFVDGVPWNGLTSVSESPSGAEPNAQYADNIKYLNLFSTEEFSATLECWTFPDEFAQFDGLGVPVPGVAIGQQVRRPFGLSYRTLKGNDVNGNDHGYKIHLIYGCMASPSEKAYSTVSDSPDPVTFSYEISTTPVAVGEIGGIMYKPTSQMVIDSTEVDADALAALELILYGDVGVDPAMPLPATVVSLFSGTIVVVTPNVPAYDDPTDTITIPAQAGVQYFIDGVLVPAGPVVITEDTMVEARPAPGYVFTAGVDNDWFYNWTP